MMGEIDSVIVWAINLPMDRDQGKVVRKTDLVSGFFIRQKSRGFRVAISWAVRDDYRCEIICCLLCY